ncbi:putative SDS22-protein phosphatase 1 regulatory subunit 7 [Sistotremastrum niveocremeum HHB9708]|uniref:Putative SDS22-protein phosphatase 1 regulatory subunit 7 n=1 Tax=Sistotremastrum niveocremeum HHB9708 TaxID=1314777 RepID=A0A164TIF7_9AGAM|nr:putative SDS22-protein phosphatase 1 regulatory subunit 7 [Sistotremastrum niveocremeum HHB9708]
MRHPRISCSLIHFIHRQSIELINARLSSDSLLNLDLPRFALSLNQLCLRQNLITHLQPSVFSPLHALQDLDLYDNKLKDIDDALDNLPLTSLDLSFNLLRSIPKGISTLTHLTTLYFVQNKISHIDGLGNLGATLTSLELGGNRLRKIENLDALVNLEELWLGKNKIAKLENLHTLSKLKILSIQSNRLIKLEGLQALTSLRELYVSHNGIERIEGLDSNLELRTLDVGSNRISKIENISHLEKLEEFWASDNQIPNLHDLDSQLAKTASLDTIYLEGNPCQKLDMAGYRRKVILALPQVTQVDATHVKAP